MQKESRTAKSIKNSSVALIIFAVDLVLQFFSRKIFLDYLGTEVLGLNTTATNLLQFLNLAELGIGTAVGFSLYKPFYEKDTQTINEIVELQGQLYRRIAYIVMSGAAVLMCFFPLIFAKMTLPLWYAYASFGVLLFSALLGYFVNYRQILLSADQKEYKIQYSYKIAILVKVIAQIVTIKYLDNGYIWWLILEVFFAVIAAFVLNCTVKETYPFIKRCDLQFRELNAKYPDIRTKIKQVFVHKISGFAMTQITPLIIYAFTSLTVVALYGNYMLIMYGLTRLSIAIFNGIIAGIGNLVAEGNQNKIMSVFEEYFSIRFYMVAIMCFGMVTLCQPFIQFWLGKEYLLDMTTLALITGIMYIYISRGAVEAYLNAFGFYSDIWSPIIEVISSVTLSIVLGHYWGLNGVLSGLLLSLISIYIFWKPVFLFAIKLKYGLKKYILTYLKHLIISFIVAILCMVILKYIPYNPYDSLSHFILYGCLSVLIYSLLLGSIMYVCKCGIRLFIKRMANIVSNV